MLSKLLYKIKNKSIKYVFLDINSLTVVPNIKKEIYLSHDRINITPFIETIKLYFTIIKILGYYNIKCFLIFDTGISDKIIKIYPKYKSNRNTRRISKNLTVFNTNVYDYNIALIKEFFDLMDEVTINNLHKIEADFVIGYLLKNIPDDKLVLSHDMDLLLAYDKNTNIIYKSISKQTVDYILVDNFDVIKDIIDFEYLSKITDLLYYRALIGDKSDNITKPFGILTKKIVNNMFSKAYMNNDNVDFEYISLYFKNKFGNDDIHNKFLSDLKRNIFIMNIISQKPKQV